MKHAGQHTPSVAAMIETTGEGKMVGAVRFELTTSCTRNKRASQATLRPEPMEGIVPASG